MERGGRDVRDPTPRSQRHGFALTAGEAGEVGLSGQERERGIGGGAAVAFIHGLFGAGSARDKY